MTLKKRKEPMIKPGIEPKVKIKRLKENQKVKEAEEEIREYVRERRPPDKTNGTDVGGDSEDEHPTGETH